MSDTEYKHWPADQPVPSGWKDSGHHVGHHGQPMPDRPGFIWIERVGPRLISDRGGPAYFERAVNGKPLSEGELWVLAEDIMDALRRIR